MRRRAYEVLDAALEVGVRYFDAARSYGNAEAFLASWLDARSLGPDDVTVGSKWGYTYSAGWRVDADVHEVKDHSLPALRRQHAESRGLVGERLALYQVHSATLESGVLEDRDVLDELARLRDDGLMVGLGVSGPRQADTIRRGLGISGANPFQAVQATWNLLEPSAGSALAEAHEAGWGVIVKEAMANGRLGPRGEEPISGTMSQIALDHGVGVDAVAIAAALGNVWADVVLSGAVTPAQVRENAAAIGVTLTGSETEALEGFSEDAEAYWPRRAQLPWT
jgi:aryl-alcohol dehydrogenase-like predicted oxidoreductase